LRAAWHPSELTAGERVGIWSPNNAEWVIAQFATAKLGLILVTINPAYRPQELEYALRKVGCAALITATAFKSSNYVEMLHNLAPEIVKGTPGKLNLKKLPDLPRDHSDRGEPRTWLPFI
jgi:fatty-acyl-CoA synthase